MAWWGQAPPWPPIGASRDRKTRHTREAFLAGRIGGAVAQDLQNWLEGRPIVARPVGLPIRLWRWSRRNRMLASTIGTFLLLAAGSVPWGIHSWKLQAAAEETTLARRSVAVLPFLNLRVLVLVLLKACRPDGGCWCGCCTSLNGNLSPSGAEVFSHFGKSACTRRSVMSSWNLRLVPRIFFGQTA